MTSEEKIDAILKLCEKHGKSIERVERGMYGDKDNKLPGLIERQLSDEERIEALERHNDRQRWWTGGAVAALSLLFSFIWGFLKDKLGL